MSVSTAAVHATEEGTKAYQGRQFDAAKVSFEQALKAAPDSGEAHYNLGLALFALGDNDTARDHFIEAANLAPGNKVIWDSPALRQYGNPDSRLPKKKGAPDYTNQKPGLGVPPGGMTR
jgi:Flp pilus assembly protein TadD